MIKFALKQSYLKLLNIASLWLCSGLRCFALALLVFFLGAPLLTLANNLPISGYIWSDNIGWISLGCPQYISSAKVNNFKILGYGFSDNIGWISFSGPNYQVEIDSLSGALKGNAWSDNIGWISFDKNLTGIPPAEPFNNDSQNFIAQYDGQTRQITGWARALSYGDGWDGWIKLSGASYGLSVNENTGLLEGYAWGGDLIGWIKFNLNTTICPVSYGVRLGDDNNFYSSAWADNIGWINFNPAGPYPASPNHSVKLEANGNITGWAKMINVDDPNANKFSKGSGKVLGFAWSDNIGWINFNPLVSPPLYGVKIDPNTGEISGNAWSDNIGWISFDRNRTGPPPDIPYNGDINYIARLNLADNKIRGWARALEACKDNNWNAANGNCLSPLSGDKSGNWDGWIKFDGPGYGVSLDPDTGRLTGFAWGSENVGWIKFAPDLISAELRNDINEGETDGWIKMSGNWENGVKFNKDSCTFSGFAFGSEPIGWLDFKRVYALFPDCDRAPQKPENLEVLSVDLCVDNWVFSYSWIFKDPDLVLGDYQSAFQIQISEKADFSVINYQTNKISSGSQTNNIAVSDISNLSYNKNYYFRVKTWDSKDKESPWSDPASFLVPHKPPRPDFEPSPKNININETITFKNKTEISPDSTNIQYKWSFSGGAPNISSSTEFEPQVKFNKKERIGVTLTASDDAGSCKINKTFDPFILPKFKECGPGATGEGCL